MACERKAQHRSGGGMHEVTRKDEIDRRWRFGSIMAAFGFALLVFGSILMQGIDTDMQLHAAFIRDYARGDGDLPSNFVFYMAVHALALFSDELQVLLAAIALLLALAVAAKFAISLAYLRDCLAGHLALASARPVRQKWLLLLCGLLLLVFSLRVRHFYLGQFPPNVWHNSTAIFLMPFALLLFWTSLRQMTQPRLGRAMLIALLSALNILIKPSFFMVFAVVYPLMLLQVHGLSRRWLLELVPVAVGALVLAVLYLFIYIRPMNVGPAGQSGIAIAPFHIWSMYTGSIPLSIVASMFFPFVYIALFPCEAWRSQAMRYALFCQFVGIVIAVLLTETGPRERHGNFFWQGIVCAYLTFLVTATEGLARLQETGPRDRRLWVLCAAFMIHVLAGVAYLVKLFLTSTVS